MHRGQERARTLFAAVGAVLVVLALGWVQPGVVPRWLRAPFGTAPHRLLPVVSTTATGSYRFTATDPATGDPVRWDPCRPLRYRINPAGAPPGGVQLVRSAVEHAQAVSGLQFEYDGTTGDRPHWKRRVFLPLGPGVRTSTLISWATAAEVPALAGPVAGVGGGASATDPDGVRRYLQGGVTLDTDAFATLEQRPDGPVLERAIVLHELGHLLGLAHVADPTQLMYPDSGHVLDYGSGDLAGLAIAGAGPCQ